MSAPERPRLARWLLRLRRLGDRRADVEADLGELFARRAGEHGVGYARRRYLRDVMSLWRARSGPAPNLETPGFIGGGVFSLARTRREADLWWRDLRHAIRALAHSPGFTAVAVGVLTLGIGASTAIYSVVDAVVLRGLPFDQADRLVAVREIEGGEAAPAMGAAPGDGFYGLVAPQDFFDWRARQHVFSDFAAIDDVSISLRPEGQALARELPAEWVTPSFFRVLRTMPIVGRPFTAADAVPGRHVAIISDDAWQRLFGGRADVVGQSLVSQLATFQVVGVMPRGFSYPVGAAEPTEIWVPWIPSPSDHVRGNDFGYDFQVIGRLRDGVTLEAARAQMTQIAASIGAQYPRWSRPVRVDSLRDVLVRPVRAWMLMLVGAVALVLLIADVNLANLLLVRATTRTSELSVRAALGASRWDLARGLLVESLALSLAGAAIGVLAARAGVDVLRAAMPAGVPRIAAIAVNGRVLLVAVAVAVATGLCFGAAPAIRFSRGGSPVSPVAREGRARIRDRSGCAARSSLPKPGWPSCCSSARGSSSRASRASPASISDSIRPVSSPSGSGR